MDRDTVIEVMREIRGLVAGSGPSLYGWDTVADALAEIDGLVQGVRNGADPSFAIAMLFAPTGRLQDLSIGNGWGDEFLELAERMDEALGRS